MVTYLSDQAHFDVSELQVPKKFHAARNRRYTTPLCARFINGSADIVKAEAKVCFADCEKI